MIRLTKEQVIALHEELIRETGGLSGIHSESLLESASNAPFQIFSNIEAYPSIRHKAVRLAFGLIQNHPFLDGNKRVGLHVMLVFLALNGIELEYEQEEIASFILDVSKGEVDTSEILRWMIEHEKG